MRVYTKICIDLTTLQTTECGYYEYEGPVELLCGGGPSDAEKSAQAQSAAESTALFNDFTAQFGENQAFLNGYLKPNLEQMFTNPTGFGPQAMADLTANLVNTTGQQAANAKQSANAAFSTQNMAGLPSGVEQAIQSQITSGAGNTIAQGQTNINLANEQYKAQQRSQALSGLEQLPGMYNQAPQTGGLLTGANQNSFNQASTINQQSMAGDFWGNLGQGLLGGAIGGAADWLTGGLAGLGGGSIGTSMFHLGGGGLGPNSPMGAPVTAVSSGPDSI